MTRSSRLARAALIVGAGLAGAVAGDAASPDCSSPPRCSDCRASALAAACADPGGLHHGDGAVALFFVSRISACRAGSKARAGSSATRRSSIARSPKRDDVIARGSRRCLGGSIVERASEPPPRRSRQAAPRLAAFRTAEARSARAALRRAAADRGGACVRGQRLAQPVVAAFGPRHERSRQYRHRCLDRSAALYRRAAGLSARRRQPHDQRADGLDAQSARAWRGPCAVARPSMARRSPAARANMPRPRASPKTQTVRVRGGGRTLGDWSLRALPDDKPMVAFSAKPARTEHDALKLAFTAGDDYGVVAVKAIIKPHGRYGKPLVVDLPLDSRFGEGADADLLSRPDRPSLCRPRCRYRAAGDRWRGAIGIQQAGALHACRRASSPIRWRAR